MPCHQITTPTTYLKFHSSVPDAYCRACEALFVFWTEEFPVQH